VIDKEGGKVPSDILCSIITRKLFLEITVNFSGVSTVYMALREPLELLVGSVLASKLKNFFVSTLLNLGSGGLALMLYE
jgi:hypothetical protein